MSWLCTTFSVLGGITLIALGYWWVVRTPGDGFIKDIWMFPPDA